MIVVEGPDGAGKTSLVEKLRQAIPRLELIPKAVSSEARSVVDVARWVEDSIARGYGPYLYDRHALISEPVYGPVWKGQPREKFRDAHWYGTAWARFSFMRPVVIICLPPPGIVWNNIQADETNRLLYRDEGQFNKIYWHYFALAAQHMDWLTYDYTYDKPDPFINYVRNKAGAR